jgi:hypothetical protein
VGLCYLRIFNAPDKEVSEAEIKRAWGQLLEYKVVQETTLSDSKTLDKTLQQQLDSSTVSSHYPYHSQFHKLANMKYLLALLAPSACLAAALPGLSSRQNEASYCDVLSGGPGEDAKQKVGDFFRQTYITGKACPQGEDDSRYNLPTRTIRIDCNPPELSV